VNSPQAGNIRPQTDFIAWLIEAQQAIFKELVAEFEKSQVISDELTPFLRSVQVPVTVKERENYDVISYPKEYGFFARASLNFNEEKKCGCLSDDAEVLIDGECKAYTDPDLEALRNKFSGDYVQHKITKVHNQRWDAALRSAFDKPTPKNPLITQFDGGFKIAPKNLGVVRMDFFRNPKTPDMVYTTVSNELQYDQVGSTQLEWRDSMLPEFLSRLEKRYHKRNRDLELYSASEQERQIAH
jgi:hypothetical protein